MKVETLPSVKGDYHLNDYEQAYREFSWEEVRKNFSWYETGKINVAYEAIDRHAESFVRTRWRFITKIHSGMKSIHLGK